MESSRTRGESVPDGDGPPGDDGGITAGPRGPSVGFLLSQLGWSTAMRFRATLEPLGIEPREFAILRALGSADGQSQQAVCHALSIPPSRMVALVDTLEKRGLVERRLNDRDRRARAIHLTKAGHEVLDSALSRIIAHEQALCEPFSDEERQQLLGLLGRLAAGYGLPRTVHPDLTTQRPLPWPGAPTPRRRKA
jgi:DNA-binding MarR family transcriptional regulator